MGDKIINKILFKERNGLDTTKELSKAIEFVHDATANMNLREGSPVPDLSPIPLAACRQVYPLYENAYEDFIAAYDNYCNGVDDTSAKDAMFAAFDAYNEIAPLLGDKMMDYGNWADEHSFPEVPEEPFLSLTDRHYNSFLQNMDRVVELIKTINILIKENLVEADRSKFISLGILLLGTSYDIFSLIRAEN